MKKGFHYLYHYHKRKFALLANAYFKKQIFYCKALHGASNFNICINCDLTVSCNCQDFDGAGRIGNLSEHSLEQIFQGEKAMFLRDTLSRRRFPLENCPVCEELQLAPAAKRSFFLNNFRVPRKGLMVENTVLCNLRCSMCHREDLLKIRGDKIMSLQSAMRVADLLKECQVENLYYFNLGEPFLPVDVHQQLEIIRSKNPNIRIITSTNGVMLDNQSKLEAALLMDYIYVSLDGPDQGVVSRYQVGSNFDKVYDNMTRLVALREARNLSRPIIEWKYVLFRWNDRPNQVRTAIDKAQAAGVDLFGLYPGGALLRNRSFRYPRHPFYRGIGTRVGDATIINFSGVPENLLFP
jgi:sulfatase maturation enzyme AslB (radical SAM superfamily)